MLELIDLLFLSRLRVHCLALPRIYLLLNLHLELFHWHLLDKIIQLLFLLLNLCFNCDNLDTLSSLLLFFCFFFLLLLNVINSLLQSFIISNRQEVIALIKDPRWCVQLILERFAIGDEVTKN